MVSVTIWQHLINKHIMNVSNFSVQCAVVITSFIKLLYGVLWFISLWFVSQKKNSDPSVWLTDRTILLTMFLFLPYRLLSQQMRDRVRRQGKYWFKKQHYTKKHWNYFKKSKWTVRKINPLSFYIPLLLADRSNTRDV